MRHNFRDLTIWKESLFLTKEIYVLSAELPIEEKFGLKSQMCRSAVSIPSNIAEGSGRTTDKEFIHFLNIAISSSYELETQLCLVADLFQINISDKIEYINTLQRKIGAFKKKLESRN